ncbi:hypothetical protein ACEWY4_007763 [Coilia grayii]|uniref:DDE Tnp4 domain-containing protein n=1 Tax=Coilia grayii TaxID=363190 RepID=A0ABD1K8Z0_9TELE
MDPTAKKVIAAYLLRRRKRRARRYWVHPVVAARQKHGEYHRLVTELRLHPLPAAIGPAQCLAICLRYLATGDSFATIAFSCRVGHCNVGRVVREVAATIWDVLLPDYMPAPSTEDWRVIANGFGQRWNFPNCVGSVDGKHVVIQAPDTSGSLYFNYKGTYSIVLLAVVDAEYLFRVVDGGGYGRTSDGGSLYASAFGEGLRDGTLGLPEDAIIPGSEHRGRMPFVFVGDEAFPLRRNLMRTFPGPHVPGEQRVYNYRPSRARMAANNATREALRVRARFASYFSEEGAVPWQVRP